MRAAGAEDIPEMPTLDGYRRLMDEALEAAPARHTPADDRRLVLLRALGVAA